MKECLAGWLFQWVEVRQFGYNTLTVGFLGTVVLSLLQMVGLAFQCRLIWKKGSGESVSVSWFSFFTVLLLVGCFYGNEVKSLALIVNGVLLGMPSVPILVGLAKFKGFTKNETRLGVVLVLVFIISTAIPHRGVLFFCLLASSLLFTVRQAHELWVAPTRGVVEGKMLVAFAASSTFWSIYGIAVNDWVMKLTYPVGLAMILIIVVIWYRKPPETEKAAT